MRKAIIPALCAALAALILAPALYAGEPEAEPKAEPKVEQAEGEAPEAAEGDEAAEATVYFSKDHESYVVQLAADAEPTNLLLTVVPKPGFKVNVEFPWKFKLGEQTMKKDAFVLTPKESKLVLAETSAEGLSGTLRFSVCNETSCLVERVQVATASPEDAADAE